MEQSNQLQENLKFGKKLVEEFELNKSVDTLGKWMLHYIAELIDKINDEESDEEVKQELKKECSEVILQFWEHRYQWPFDCSFEDLLYALDQISECNIHPARKFWDTKDSQLDSLLELRNELERINEEEIRIIEITKLLSSNVREALEQKKSIPNEYLNEKEEKLLAIAQDVYERMNKEDSKLYKIEAPYFSEMSRKEKEEILAKELKQFDTDRANIYSIFNKKLSEK